MKTKKIVTSAIIASLYAAFTLMLYPVSFGPVQLRVSEALTCLPIFTPYAIFGLSVGCLVANLLGGYGLLDVVLGTVATLIGAIGTRLLRTKPFLAMLCPVVTNALIIGPMLYFVAPESPSLLINVLTVGLGELCACQVIGLPLIWLLKKHDNIFKL